MAARGTVKRRRTARRVLPSQPPQGVTDIEPLVAARAAGLHYVNDHSPGLTRHTKKHGVEYRNASGKLIEDQATLARIRSLVIPPAWTSVWICPDPQGHIQATGRDARGRKQYRYHPDWRSTRDSAKFDRMAAFGAVLPRIRRRVDADLRRNGLGRDKVLAAIVRLLETTFIRIGNPEYFRENHSVGLTTMRNRHVTIRGGSLHFEFRGKSGKKHAIDLEDHRLARVVRSIQELPGQELFHYLDENGASVKVTSTEVNEYLHRIAGAEFSAKDFRTWAGTMLAALELGKLTPFRTKAEAKRNQVTAIAAVAAQLGNTPAVCRKCYIHPVVLDSYMSGLTVKVGSRGEVSAQGRTRAGGLSPGEKAVLALLQKPLRR